MGMTWRFAMPLLSTLAALVIIVHSAEENLDREHRYDLRPRRLDTRSPENDQPWRIVRSEPIIQQPEEPSTWNKESKEEAPVRRRMGRKRKRRPPLPESEEDNAQDPYTLPDNSPKGDEEYDTHYIETDSSGRRRRKLKPNRSGDESENAQRSVRRRNQKRKRPSLDTWPQLSEFGGFPRNKRPYETDTETLIQTDIDEDNIGQPKAFGEDQYILKSENIQNGGPRFVLSKDNEQRRKKISAKDDKSLSEFSMELMGPSENTNFEVKEYDDKGIRTKVQDKSPNIFINTDKAKESGPIDPLTLKDILKRSNGTSLSEILQQHNLSLADLLNGKENAISVLKSEKSLQKLEKNDTTNLGEKKYSSENITNKQTKEENKDDASTTTPEKVDMELVAEHNTFYTNPSKRHSHNVSKVETAFDEMNEKKSEAIEKPVISSERNTMFETNLLEENTTITPKLEQRTSGMMARPRFPGAIRRKLRMRPTVNNTYKSQLSRDLIALSARRYIHHSRRNATKAKQWREMIPLMINANKSEEPRNILITTTPIPEETTLTLDEDESTESAISEDNTTTESTVTETDNIITEAETTTISVEILATEMDINITEKPKINRPVNPLGLRRQANNNRLKRKRMKYKTSSTEAPQNDIMKNLLSMGDLVSSSEFIAKTQLPKVSTPEDNTETVTELEDFMTTRSMSKSSMRSTRLPITRNSGRPATVTRMPIIISTEETAKIEIEEILNDTQSSAKLSKILRERNMTLSELLDHRERGSSQVHLADIFHNASREPNPPEPFLSKSLIEPISKETYPLRALLEANLHDPANKATTVDPILTNHINIPVIMAFGNNVNENAENMGIMSLFNNFTKNTGARNKDELLQKDSNGTPYKSTIIAVNTTDHDDTRESRTLTEDDDMISWNEIFSMIRKNQKTETKPNENLSKDIASSDTFKKITLEEDLDGDGLIVLEDLQHLNELDNNSVLGSEEKLEFRTLDRTEIQSEPGILNKSHNSAKSVTVATASIVGLAMILFLLTYAALKWKQQRSMSHKKAYCDERIPTPVYENRKVKKNCSSRSISPMLPTSNIYTMSTLESQNGKDSPEYMWDTLRKPFQ